MLHMFQINESVFYIIAGIIYITIFIGTILSLIKFRHNITGKKIMILGFSLIILGFIFFSVPDFQFKFPMLNFLTLLYGVVLLYVGFCVKD